MAACTCCDEREEHPLCDGLCVDCAKPAHCSQCDRELCDDDDNEWTPTNQVEPICHRCERSNETDEWIQATRKEVERLADEHGWDFGRWAFAANSQSRYIELTRECDTCILGSGGDCTCETLKVRVSDHADAYCNDDFSLAFNPGGDDHTIEELGHRLARRVTA